MLHAFAGICLFSIAAAIIPPREIRGPTRREGRMVEVCANPIISIEIGKCQKKRP